jgi:hypothetical protein
MANARPFSYLRFKTFSMTPRTPQCEVFWALLSNPKHSGVPEDSKSPTLEVLGFTPTLGQSGVATEMEGVPSKRREPCVVPSNFSFRCVWRDDLEVTLNCLSVSHQNNVPRAILSDTTFLRLRTTLVSKKHLSVPQSDDMVCVEGFLECVVVYRKTYEPYCCSTIFSF